MGFTATCGPTEKESLMYQAGGPESKHYGVKCDTVPRSLTLSSLRPRSLASKAVLFCWIGWFVLRCIAAPLFRFLADRDIYSALLRAYDDAPFVLLDSVLVPAIVYGLVLARGTAWRLTETEAAPLDTKRLVALWLLWAASCAFADVHAAAGLLGVGAVLICLWKWRRVFGLSCLRPRASDLAFGALGGYLCYNIQVLIPALRIPWPGTISWMSRPFPHQELLFVYSVLLIPATEELLSRGAMLASLLKKMPAPWAVLITSAAAAVVHLPPARWSSAFVAWLILCGIYLVRGRSLPASFAAHAVTNALAWRPGLVLTGYLLK